MLSVGISVAWFEEEDAWDGCGDICADLFLLDRSGSFGIARFGGGISADDVDSSPIFRYR